MNSYLRKLVEGQHLTEEEMYEAGLLLLSDNILESEVAAFFSIAGKRKAKQQKKYTVSFVLFAKRHYRF